MFVAGTRGYGRDGSQRAAGRFLMLFCEKSGGELRALVRYVRMHQVGHFMMGTATVKSEAAHASADPEPSYSTTWRRRVFDGRFEIGLSGTYGEDGLPISAERYPGLWGRLHPVPAELAKKFWAGGGHNSAGSEGPAMHEWAKANASTLSRLRPGEES